MGEWQGEEITGEIISCLAWISQKEGITFWKCQKLKDLCIRAAKELGRGKALPEPPVPPPSHNQLLATPPFTLQSISRARGPGTPLTPPHTHTHTLHTRTAHTQPPHSGAPASSPICILPCSGFSFNMQVFPQGRGRGGYSGGDMMRRKRYGENKYFWSVNLTFFFLLKISLAYSILSV